MIMNPWMTKQLVEIRVAELHRDADLERLGITEPLPSAHVETRRGTWSLLRRGLGSALVRAGGRVGGFESSPAWTIGGRLNS
jgi:hypothetical protein